MTSVWEPEFTVEDVEILHRRRVFQGYIPMDECVFKFRHFNGGWSHDIKRELILRPKVVAVLLYDPKKDQVIMIEQIRVGAFHYNESPWILEIVAGMVDENETLAMAAQREAFEEAGVSILKLLKVCTFLVSPGISDEETTIFCGIIDAPDQGGYHGLVDDGEDIKVHVLQASDAILLLNQGKITSASAVIAVQWLAINHVSLRSSQ